MRRSILAVALIVTGAVAMTSGATSPEAAPLKPADQPSTSVNAQSDILHNVHGRHCGWRRGHRHPWACRRTRGYGSPEVRYRNPDNPYGDRRYDNSSYADYPFWANKSFTDADDRGGRGGRR